MAGFPETILVATDGSKDSELSVRRAVDLAGGTGASLHLAYVMILSHWMVPDTLSDAQYERLKGDAQRLLDQQLEKAEAAGADPDAMQKHLRIGRRADEEIIKLAEEIEADMVVVGSRGAGTISRAFMGSDAESIVRHADRPVLVVRNQEDGR
ncbi:MAG: universal stress protein [Rubrobacteraceae bacterium]